MTLLGITRLGIYLLQYSDTIMNIILHYLISTGNRLSTVTNLKIKDLDLDNQLMTLRHTKNRTQQIIPLASSMCKILRAYLQYRGGSSDDYLFPSINNIKLTKSTIISAIKIYNLSRGISMFSIHAFRRYFAKQCVLNGMDTFTLQRLGGWKNLEVVNNYIKIYATDIKNYDNVNPLEVLYSKTEKQLKCKQDGCYCRLLFLGRKNEISYPIKKEAFASNYVFINYVNDCMHILYRIRSLHHY